MTEYDCLLYVATEGLIIARQMDDADEHKSIAGPSLLPNDKHGSSKAPKNISVITTTSSGVFGFGQDVSSDPGILTLLAPVYPLEDKF